jgi:hypothetical protein
MLRDWCIEKILIPHLGSSERYHLASAFMPGRCKGRHGHGDGWRWWVLFHTFFGHDSPRRFGTLDVEFGRTQ